MTSFPASHFFYDSVIVSQEHLKRSACQRNCVYYTTLFATRVVSIKSVNNFAIIKSIYKDKNNNKFKNKLVKAFRNMHLQYYIDIHKYTVEIKPEFFLDTKMVYSNDVLTAEVKRNERKLPVHWSSSKVPKRYKRNAIISDLNRATRIASFPADEIPKIKQKFLNADYPHKFINSVINNFQEKSEETDSFIIPPWFL